MPVILHACLLFLTLLTASAYLLWNDAKANGFCQNPNIVSIAGSSPTRMVQEGGRIVILCCILGNSSGHDHEQLMWIDPSGKSIINYFSNAVQAAQSKTYAIPDFSDKTHIM
ncbi:hypothetical protein ACTXT7_015037 [Hymenolepis weldensis]